MSEIEFSESTDILLNSYNLNGIIDIPEVDQEILDSIQLNEKGEIINYNITIKDEDIDEAFKKYKWSQEEEEQIKSEVERDIKDDDINEAKKDFDNKKKQINELSILFDDVKNAKSDLENIRNKKKEKSDKIKETEAETVKIDNETSNASSTLDNLKEYETIDLPDMNTITNEYQKIQAMIPNLNILIEKTQDDSPKNYKIEVKEDDDDAIATLTQIKDQIENLMDAFSQKKI